VWGVWGVWGVVVFPSPLSPLFLLSPLSPPSPDTLLLVCRTVTVIVVSIVETVFGAEEQAAYGKEDC